jgi:hypothetical protein
MTEYPSYYKLFQSYLFVLIGERKRYIHGKQIFTLAKPLYKLTGNKIIYWKWPRWIREFSDSQ